MRQLLSLAILFVFVACSARPPDPSDHQSTPPETDVESSPDVPSDSKTEPKIKLPETNKIAGLEVLPANPILEVDPGERASQAFQVLDRQGRDITTEVQWEVPIGTMVDGTLTLPGSDDVGVTTVDLTARHESEFGQARLTVAVYRQGTDFFFTLPYQGQTDRKPLTFSTEARQADVFFDIDISTSMKPTLDGLKANLKDRIVPEVRKRIANTHFGVGTFEEFPCYFPALIEKPCSSPTDLPFKLEMPISDNISELSDKLNGVTIANPTTSSNGDKPESLVESLWQIATGDGLDLKILEHRLIVPPYGGSGRGGVGFREDSLPIVVAASDAPSHNGIYYSYSSQVPEVAMAAAKLDPTIEKLNSFCAKTVGLHLDREARPDLVHLAQATGAVVPPIAWGPESERPLGCEPDQCCSGISGASLPPRDGTCPLVFDATGQGGLIGSIVSGIEKLQQFSPVDVRVEISGEQEDIEGEALEGPCHSTTDFIKKVETQSFQLPKDKPLGLPEPEDKGDHFSGVTPGTQVIFDVSAENTCLEPSEEARIFKATISVLAGNCYELDQRTVLIFVPAERVPVVVR